MHLRDYENPTWYRTEISGVRAELNGTLRFDDYRNSSVSLVFAREEGEWRIAATAFSQGILVSPQAAARKLPTRSEQRSIAEETMATFLDSMNAASPEDFYASMAALTQLEVPLTEFSQQMESLLAEADWRQSSSQPDLQLADSSHLVDQGVLRMSGFYRREPLKLIFHTSHLWQEGRWRPKLVSVELTDAESLRPMIDLSADNSFSTGDG